MVDISYCRRQFLKKYIIVGVNSISQFFTGKVYIEKKIKFRFFFQQGCNYQHHAALWICKSSVGRLYTTVCSTLLMTGCTIN